MTPAQVVRKRRLELGWTQAEVAERAGMTREMNTHVSRFECGYNSVYPAMRKRILAALGLDERWAEKHPDLDRPDLTQEEPHLIADPEEEEGALWYVGVRGPDGADVRIFNGANPTDVQAVERAPSLPQRQDLMNHSPDGLEWGYAGSGPAQTALALLAHASGSDSYALAMYQHFKHDHVARFPVKASRRAWALRVEWFITRLQLWTWIQWHQPDVKEGEETNVGRR